MGSVVDEVAGSEEASAAATEEALVEEEEGLDTKVVVVSAEEVEERLMAMVTQRHPLMLLQVQAETEAAWEVGMVAHLSTAA